MNSIQLAFQQTNEKYLIVVIMLGVIEKSTLLNPLNNDENDRKFKKGAMKIPINHNPNGKNKSDVYKLLEHTHNKML